MKKLLVLALVLSMASMANAALTLGPSATDGKVGDAITISISGDGATALGTFYMGVVAGGGATLNVENAVIVYPGSDVGISWVDDAGIAPFIAPDLGGVNNPFLNISLNDMPPPQTPGRPYPLTGSLVTGIALNLASAGTVTIVLTDIDGNLLTSQAVTISDVPEPITVGLLGLGAMFLRRRK